MNMNFMAALVASLIISSVSLIGVISLMLSDRALKPILVVLVGLSAGALIGGAFLHILPEAVTSTNDYPAVFLYVIAGFFVFFVLEHFMHWRHCHNRSCEVHTFAYINLAGDAAHNFIDGIIIGTSFAVSVPFGITTSMAILLHEIPQEIGDFGVLVYGGFSKSRALMFNFFTALLCVAGTAIGFAFSEKVAQVPAIMLPLAAGGFIYIASCDLIPEIHRQTDKKKALISILMFLAGVGLMYLMRII